MFVSPHELWLLGHRGNCWISTVNHTVRSQPYIVRCPEIKYAVIWCLTHTCYLFIVTELCLSRSQQTTCLLPCAVLLPCFHSFVFLPLHLWAVLNRTSSNSAALFTNSVSRKIQSSAEEWHTFSLCLHLLLDETEHTIESDIEKTPSYVYHPVLFTFYNTAEGDLECTVCPLTWQLTSNSPSSVFTAL